MVNLHITDKKSNRYFGDFFSNDDEKGIRNFINQIPKECYFKEWKIEVQIEGEIEDEDLKLLLETI